MGTTAISTWLWRAWGLESWAQGSTACSGQVSFTSSQVTSSSEERSPESSRFPFLKRWGMETPATEDTETAGVVGGSSSSGSSDRGEGQPARNEYRNIAEVEASSWASARRDPATGLPVCATCQRLGHPLCGLRYWISLRAAWLRLPEQLVAEEPKSFEDPGSIQIARQAEIGFVREISEGEAEDLEDCLDAIQRPFPRLRRSIPLSQAVQYAEALWDTDD